MAQLKSTLINGDLTVTDTINGISFNAQSPRTVLAGPSYSDISNPTVGAPSFKSLSDIISTTSITISTDAWTGNSPSIATITGLSNLTTTSQAIVGISSTASQDQYNAVSNAQLLANVTSNGTLAIKCFGIVPTIAVPITIMIF